MEGKEQRLGIAGSALFDVVTTVTSCGAVNSSIESYTGLGGAIPFANLSASEVIFGGVGTGSTRCWSTSSSPSSSAA